jgi:hypothetical protein
MKSLILISLGLLLMSSSCKKRPETCNWSHFTFEHPVTVYPVKDSYNIGDTIWFEMNFSDVFNTTVKNNYNGDFRSETVQLKNFDFHRTFISISKITDTTKNMESQLHSWNSFKSNLIEGSVINEFSDGPEYKLSYYNSSYHFKMYVILNEKGKYLCSPFFMHYYPNAHNSLNAVEIRPECDAEQIEDIRFPVNRQTDGTFKTNYHLFEQYMNPALENDIERIKKECFTFVVK